MKFNRMGWFAALSATVFLTAASSQDELLDPAERASRLFSRLTGLPLQLSDPRRSKLIELVSLGQLEAAARIATDDDAFLNVTIRHFSSSFGNRGESPLSAMDDVSAMMMGTVRDDRDFREVLFGDYTYTFQSPGKQTLPVASPASDRHYVQAEEQGLNYRRTLVRQEPQDTEREESSGVLTSRAWAGSHLEAGTNRRAIEYTFRQFLCTPLQDMRDASIQDFRVHRDVDRSPGGNSNTYLNTCRSCHGGLDALVGAYAHYRFDFTTAGQRLLRESRIQRKMNQNGNVYPEGHVTTDDSWFNFFTQNQNAQFGWRGNLQGRGIKEYGTMLSNSRGFSRCMVKKAFSQLCQREIAPSEESTLDGLATSFEQSGYRLKHLFEQTAMVPACL